MTRPGNELFSWLDPPKGRRRGDGQQGRDKGEPPATNSVASTVPRLSRPAPCGFAEPSRRLRVPCRVVYRAPTKPARVHAPARRFVRAARRRGPPARPPEPGPQGRARRRAVRGTRLNRAEPARARRSPRALHLARRGWSRRARRLRRRGAALAAAGLRRELLGLSAGLPHLGGARAALQRGELPRARDPP